jgi:cyclophilin family peptidyl-prolyl cis-trans isomerase
MDFHTSGGIDMKSLRLRLAIILAVTTLATALPGLGQKKAAKSKANPVVALETTMGTIKIQLFADKSPITVKNFLDYAGLGFYNGTIVHRVDFVIGMGGYTEALMGKRTMAEIKNESKNGLKNLRGTVAMARYTDPNSATSQFFINLKNSPNLDASGGSFGYAVFGKVIGGMDVVDSIAKVKTTNKRSFTNIPVQTITVKSVKVIAK